jgi:hypothetical protein
MVGLGVDRWAGWQVICSTPGWRFARMFARDGKCDCLRRLHFCPESGRLSQEGFVFVVFPDWSCMCPAPAVGSAPHLQTGGDYRPKRMYRKQQARPAARQPLERSGISRGLIQAAPDCESGDCLRRR